MKQTILGALIAVALLVPGTPAAAAGRAVASDSPAVNASATDVRKIRLVMATLISP